MIPNLGLSTQELEMLTTDVLGIIQGRPYDINLIRQGAVLPSQRCRAERTKFRLIEHQDPVTKTVGQEVRQVIVIVGDTSLDIKRGDEFTFEGYLYRVEVVDPNRQIGVTARAELAQ